MDNHLPLTLPQAKLLTLIGGYVRSVDAVIRMVLRHGHLVDRPRNPSESESLPRRGVVLAPFRGTFRFRAHGCVIQARHMRWEFDFGPENRHDGFSAHLLERHVSLNKLQRRYYGDLNIRTGLAELNALGAIRCPEWEPTPYLSYLTEQGTSLIESLRAFPGV